MLLIQMTGPSGVGKTTIANRTRELLAESGLNAIVIDENKYRRLKWKDFGLCRKAREKRIKKMGLSACRLALDGAIVILDAINPFERVRRALKLKNPRVRTVSVTCDMKALMRRAIQKIYHIGSLPNDHPDKVYNLVGVNHPYEVPMDADFRLNTDDESPEDSAFRLASFIKREFEEFQKKLAINLALS